MTEPLDAVRALVEEMEQEARRVDPKDAEHQSEFEDAARGGALGPQWRRLQARIDGGRTTLVDVFGGTDASPEAAAVRDAARSGLAEVRKATEQAAAESAAASPDEQVEDPLRATAQANDDLRARVDALRRELGSR